MRRPNSTFAAHVAMGEQGVVLEHEAHAATVGRHVGHVDPVDEHAARRRTLQAGHAAQDGGLPAPGGAEERHHLAGCHVEGHVVDGRELPPGEADDEILHREGCTGRHQNSEAPAGRTRSMASTTTTVTNIRIVDRAMAWPNSSAPGRPRNR